MKTRNFVKIDYVENIRLSGFSIYDPIEKSDPNLWIPNDFLERVIANALIGESMEDLPLRTRSKRIKELVCKSLGYPIPTSFRKTQPRFPGQDFDTYTQKSNNLQIWNEEISPTRRYVLLKVDEAQNVVQVRVVDGIELSRLDTTGTLTQKYQARLIVGNAAMELVTGKDTEHLSRFLTSSTRKPNLRTISPIEEPQNKKLIPIKPLFEQLKSLVGVRFEDAGHDQERNRGAILHRLISEKLGFRDYRDDGRFPDIRNQLLEVKLQTSPTIDLGLVRPNSEEILNTKIAGNDIRHCDVRYALFYGNIESRMITLTNFYLTTGEKFFSRFPQFQGNVLNKKLQIRLPDGFFKTEGPPD